jgi:pyruvate dehydrogenase E2 component (dihydrolipoamide acetyltransferase)
MVTSVKMPELSTTSDTVTLVKWLIKEGDSVRRGDILCEIETDKATNGLESIAEGTILKILVEEGTEIGQGTVIAYIGKPGEQLPDTSNKLQLSETERSAGQNVKSVDDGLKISLIIRNLADKYGVDLKSISGTGPMGRITREDVLMAKDIKISDKIPGINSKPLSANQAIIARRVLQSINYIAPIHIESKIDMTSVIKMRNTINSESGEKAHFDAFFVKALAGAMRRFPHFRSRIENEQIIEISDVNIGIAMSKEYDLYIPVIRNCDTKTITEINHELKQLSEKASENRFAQEDLTGATVSVSNLGMFPIRSFHAVIPPDQISILSIGAIEETAIVKNGQINILPIAIITLTVDHKLINGREAGEFLTILKEEIESI